MNTLATPALVEQARHALLAHDSNADVQADADGGLIVRTTLDQTEGVRLLQAAALPLATRTIAAPSDCCGGCCGA